MRQGVVIGTSISVVASLSSVSTYYIAGPSGQLAARACFGVIMVGTMYLAYNSLYYRIMELARRRQRDRSLWLRYRLLLVMLANLGAATVLDWFLPTGLYRSRRLSDNVTLAILAFPYADLMWRVMCHYCVREVSKATPPHAPHVPGHQQ